MSADTTTFDKALKRVYAPTLGKLPNANHPFLGRLKNVKAGGSAFAQPVRYNDYNAVSTSATYSQMVTAAGEQSSGYAQFLISCATRLNGLAIVDPATQLVSEGNLSAWMDARTAELDAAKNNLVSKLSNAVFRSGYGELSTLKQGVSVSGATTITLASRRDARAFKIGDELSVAATLTGATRALGSSGRGLIITGINRNASTAQLTFGFAIDDATNGIPNIAAGDYIFIRSFRPTGSSPTRTVQLGLAAWLPTSAPGGGDSHHGVDRSTSDLLYGAILSGGTSYFDALVDTAAELAARGASPDVALVSPFRFGEMLKENRNSTVFQAGIVKGALDMSWSVLKFNGIDIMSDEGMPDDRMYVLDMKSWGWASPVPGTKINIDDLDGRVMRKSTTTGNYHMDLFAQGNLTCERPGHNAVYSFTNNLSA